MSGPSAIEKPMSAKIAVISSTTWLIGWIRPRSAGEGRTGRLTSTLSRARRSVMAASRKFALAHGDGVGDTGLEPVDCGASFLALLGGHLAQALKQLRYRAFLAECRDPHRFDGGLVGRARNLGHDGGFECSGTGS
jgi:hypothetical protein